MAARGGWPVSRHLLTTHQAAVYIGRSCEWTRTSLADGTIPGARKVRGRWVIERAAVDGWLDAGRPEKPETDGERYAPVPRVMRRTVDAA